MTWKPEIDELRERQELARRMGGKEKVERQHHYGKLTIRERIDCIVDDGSFQEIGALAGVGNYGEDGRLESFTPSNFVLGMAEIDGRPVVVSGDDFTVRGGSADASIKAKRLHSEGLALDLHLPHVRLVVSLTSTAGRSLSSPRTSTSTAAVGRPTRVASSPDSSISPPPSISHCSISRTAPGFGSASRPSKNPRSDSAPRHSPLWARPRCHSAAS